MGRKGGRVRESTLPYEHRTVFGAMEFPGTIPLSIQNHTITIIGFPHLTLH